MKGRKGLYHAYEVVDKAARGGETVLKHLEYYVNSTENSVFYYI